MATEKQVQEFNKRTQELENLAREAGIMAYTEHMEDQLNPGTYVSVTTFSGACGVQPMMLPGDSLGEQ